MCHVLLSLLLLGVSQSMKTERSLAYEDVSGLDYVNDMEILPADETEVKLGSNIVLTCRLLFPTSWPVSHEEKLDWYNPKKNHIENTERWYQTGERIYAEKDFSSNSISLFIKNITENDAGKYMCIRDIGTQTFSRKFVNIKVYAGLRWTDCPPVQYAARGSSILLKCRANAKSPPRVNWNRADTTLKSGGKYQVTPGGLRIDRVEYQDKGNYTCRATVSHTGELEERTVQLELGQAPNWQVKPKNITVKAGVPVSVDCSGTGFPEPRTTWSIRTNDQEMSDRRVLSNGTLFFPSITTLQSGVYGCTVKNILGFLDTSFFIRVVHQPHMQSINNITVREGQRNMMLICRVSGDPTPSISWSKLQYSPETGGSWNVSVVEIPGTTVNQNIVKKIKRHQDLEYVLESTVVIGSVQRKHAGVYYCQASNEGGTVSQAGVIDVLFSPYFNEPQDIIRTWHQQIVRINCSVSSIPEANITWWFRGQQIGVENQDRKYKIYFTSSFSQLHIEPTSDKYLGSYTCKATNKLGTAEHSTQVVQATVPGPIQQLIVDRVYSTRFFFRIIPPKYSGGLVVDYFLAEYKESRQSWKQAKRKVWLSSSEHRYSLENLSPTKTYNFRLGVGNKVGVSTWSRMYSVTLMPAGKPDPPLMDFSIFNLDNHRHLPRLEVVNLVHLYLNSSDEEILSVRWNLQDDRGSKIFAVILQYYPVEEEPGVWVRSGNITTYNISSNDNCDITVDEDIQHLYVSLQAENKFGLSTRQEYILILRQETEVQLQQQSVVKQQNDISIYTIILTVSVFLICAVIVDILCLVFRRRGLVYTSLTKTKICRKLLGSGKKNRNCSTRSRQGRNVRKGTRVFV